MSRATPSITRRGVVAAGLALATQPAWASVVESESARINRWFEIMFDRRVARDPALQSSMGVATARWPDVGDAHAAEGARTVANELAELKRFDFTALTPEAQLSYKVYAYEGEAALTAYRWRVNHYPVCQMRGPQRSIPQALLNNHPIAGRHDAESYVARIRGVKAYLTAVVEALDAQQVNGVMPPHFSYALVIGNCAKLIAGAPFDASSGDSPVLADFKAKVAALTLPAADETKLVADAKDALRDGFAPGFRALIAWLRAAEAAMPRNDGVWALPNGEAYYAAKLALETTLPLSPGAVHRIGLDEVARLHGAIGALMKRVGFAGSRADFFAHVRGNPRFFYPDTAQGRAAYLDAMHAKIAAVDARLGEIMTRVPKARMVVRPVEPWLEKSAGIAGYFAPSADGSRPGILYVNTLHMRALPKYALSALSFHEGVPGHHLQNAVAQELTELPRFRRFGDYTAYSEGWALYAEQLPVAMGMYDDPWQEFGRLSEELMRAGRLVVDTGLHAKRWTREQAIAWLDANTAAGHDDNVTAVQRYIVTPAQATAYEIGKLEIVALRDRARARLGKDFDLRRFNDVVLGDGPLPLPLLKVRVERWLAGGGREGT